MFKFATCLLLASSCALKVNLKKQYLDDEHHSNFKRDIVDPVRPQSFRSSYDYLMSYFYDTKSSTSYKKRLQDGKQVSFGATIYTGDIYIGSSYAQSTVAFATTGFSTGIVSSTCTDCYGSTKFDKTTSTSYDDTGLTNDNDYFSEFFYYSGTTFTDTICLTSSSVVTPSDIYCADMMPMILITEENFNPVSNSALTPTSPFSGVVGLSYAKVNTIRQDKLFVPEFISHVQAGKGTFSSNIFALNYDSSNMYIDLGEVDSAAYVTSDAVDFSMTYELYWYIESQGVRFQNDQNEYDYYQWYYGVNEALWFDNLATDYIYIPYDFETNNGLGVFLNKLFGGNQYLHDEANDLYYVRCSDPWYSFDIIAQNYYLNITKDMYLKSSTYDSEYDCQVRIRKSGIMYIGPLILDGYYVIHDADNNKVTVAPTTSGGKSKLQDYQGYTLNEFPTGDSMSIFVVSSYIIGFIGWYYMFYQNIFPDPIKASDIEEEEQRRNRKVKKSYKESKTEIEMIDESLVVLITK